MKLSKDKVNVAMARRGFTNKQLAEAAGLSRQRIGQLLNSVSVQPRSAGRLAAALQVDVSELVD